MTLKDAIVKFDTEYFNTIPDEIKIDWLSTLDSVIHQQIISTHQNPSPVSFDGYSEETPEDTLLLVPEPFSDIYIRFLAMKKDLYLNDLSRYNNDLVMYSTAFIEYKNFYNKNNMPLKKTSFFNA